MRDLSVGGTPIIQSRFDLFTPTESAITSTVACRYTSESKLKSWALKVYQRKVENASILVEPTMRELPRHERSQLDCCSHIRLYHVLSGLLAVYVHQMDKRRQTESDTSQQWGVCGEVFSGRVQSCVLEFGDFWNHLHPSRTCLP